MFPNLLTKRIMLKFMASIYDPLGLACPVLITAKSLFQEMCRLKLKWDDAPDDKIRCAWNKWKNDIACLADYNVPRCLQSDHPVSRELHVFLDGSEKAYGCVAYLKCISACDIKVTIVAARSKLTPLSGTALVTTPRIELAAAKLGVELLLKLREEFSLKIDGEFLWSDSVTVLRYIKNETSRFQRFVANKVSFIRNFTAKTQWFYVPSQQNPADIITRGTTVSKLKSSRLWNEGPQFLKTSDNPAQTYEVTLNPDDLEIKKESTCHTTAIEETHLDKLMTSTSSFYKLKLRVAYLLRFRSLLLKRNPTKDHVSVQELEAAEMEIFRYVQKKQYSEIIKSIGKGKNIPKRHHLRKLSPFIDANNLLRVGGRIQNSSATFEVKHPIILPNSSNITSMIVEDIHRTLGHSGRESMLCKLRARFWIIGASNLVRKIANNCITCRKYQGKASVQIMSNLPISRVTADIPAFTHVGLDCFGPFDTICGRKVYKRYGLIFVCFSSKAVHLEILHSLSTDSFINGLRRFISRRGNVESITSDNGTNFKGAEKELKKSIEEWNSVIVSNWLRQKSVSWKFNPPGASHFGGIWERQIRSVRKVLNGLLSEQPIKFTDELLCTLLCEVESILNNRPLTEIINDPKGDYPLTPNHLLLLNAGVTFPPGLFSKDDSCSKRRYKQVQYLSDLFWSRWRKEYLVLLQEKQKWHDNRKSLEVGDLVLVMDVNLPRNQWPLGVVEEALKDKCNDVRVVKIRTSKYRNSSKSKNGSVLLKRPISKVIVLKNKDQLTN